MKKPNPRRSPLPRLGIALLSLVLAAIGASAQQTVFHSEVHLVTLTFSVHDASGKLVSGLDQDAFQVFEDGVPQKIVSLASGSELPLSIGLLVDGSDSQSKFLKRHTKDVELFLQQILRPQDQVFAIGFGDHVRLVADLTSSPAPVIDGLTEYDKGRVASPNSILTPPEAVAPRSLTPSTRVSRRS